MCNNLVHMYIVKDLTPDHLKALKQLIPEYSKSVTLYKAIQGVVHGLDIDARDTPPLLSAQGAWYRPQCLSVMEFLDL